MLAYAFAQSCDPDDMLRKMKRQHIYLCRYMHVSLERVEDMDAEEIRDYMEELSEVIKQETPTPAGPGSQ